MLIVCSGIATMINLILIINKARNLRYLDCFVDLLSFGGLMFLSTTATAIQISTIASLGVSAYLWKYPIYGSKRAERKATLEYQRKKLARKKLFGI